MKILPDGDVRINKHPRGDFERPTVERRGTTMLAGTKLEWPLWFTIGTSLTIDVRAQTRAPNPRVPDATVGGLMTGAVLARYLDAAGGSL